jgi:hypothetical protein
MHTADGAVYYTQGTDSPCKIYDKIQDSYIHKKFPLNPMLYDGFYYCKPINNILLYL